MSRRRALIPDESDVEELTPDFTSVTTDLPSRGSKCFPYTAPNQSLSHFLPQASTNPPPTAAAKKGRRGRKKEKAVATDLSSTSTTWDKGKRKKENASTPPRGSKSSKSITVPFFTPSLDRHAPDHCHCRQEGRERKR